MVILFWICVLGMAVGTVFSLLFMLSQNQVGERQERFEMEYRGNWCMSMAMLFGAFALIIDVHDHVEKMQEQLAPKEIKRKAEVIEDAPVYAECPEDWWR